MALKQDEKLTTYNINQIMERPDWYFSWSKSQVKMVRDLLQSECVEVICPVQQQQEVEMPASHTPRETQEVM